MIPYFITGFLVVEVDAIVDVVVVVTGVVLGFGAVTKKEKVLVKTGPGIELFYFAFPRN